ncbi:hypothetical protein [Novosphingobium profundi]|uniref:hypothetical protein n=1 Tax=Novosphingobium profundi TaxID=1774954 RepID=UPI001FEB2610|nr:hypothetical protein [Novosphingobium profundi]
MMAKGIPFPEANMVLGPPTPEDGVAGTVYSLHVHRYRDLDNRPHVLSKWEFTPEEIEEINRTGCAWFGSWGETHPPIWISGKDPFVQRSKDDENAI